MVSSPVEYKLFDWSCDCPALPLRMKKSLMYAALCLACGLSTASAQLFTDNFTRGTDPAALTADQRYAIAYWFALLSVFDSSGPAAFARAMIRTYEHNDEDPVRRCFFLVTKQTITSGAEQKFNFGYLRLV